MGNYCPRRPSQTTTTIRPIQDYCHRNLINRDCKAAAEAYGVSPDKAYCKPEDIANDKDVDMVVVSVKVNIVY